MNWYPYSQNVLLGDAVSSIILIAALFAVRAVLLRTVINRPLPHDLRRRSLVNLRNALLFVFLVGLVFIWAHELRTFTVSLVALAVAIVIATKELILCFSGAVLRAGSNAYAVGDCVDIEGVRGEVVDQNWLSTTVLEIGPGRISHQYTGRAVVFPNSLLLSKPLINENYMGEYVVHVLSVPLDREDDWAQAETILLEAACAECAPFMESARRHMKRLERKEWLDTPSIEPRVSLEIPDAQEINLLLRFPAPVRRKGRVEQAILRRFLNEFQGASRSRREEADDTRSLARAGSRLRETRSREARR